MRKKPDTRQSARPQIDFAALYGQEARLYTIYTFYTVQADSSLPSFQYIFSYSPLFTRLSE